MSSATAVVAIIAKKSKIQNADLDLQSILNQLQESVYDFVKGKRKLKSSIPNLLLHIPTLAWKNSTRYREEIVSDDLDFYSKKYPIQDEITDIVNAVNLKYPKRIRMVNV